MGAEKTFKPSTLHHKKRRSKMEIIKVKIDDIKAYENNAKIHTPEQVEQIKASILEFGFNDPIAIDENNTVIEGHGRLMALQELGYKEVDCIRLSHLTKEQKCAYILVHNKLTMNTDFDFNILDSELAKIEDIDMTQFDFEEMDFDESDFDCDFSLNTSDKPLARTITLTLSEQQFVNIQKCIDAISEEKEFENNGISNANGNAVYEIVKEWGQDK